MAGIAYSHTPEVYVVLGAKFPVKERRSGRYVFYKLNGTDIGEGAFPEGFSDRGGGEEPTLCVKLLRAGAEWDIMRREAKKGGYEDEGPEPPEALVGYAVATGHSVGDSVTLPGIEEIDALRKPLAREIKKEFRLDVKPSALKLELLVESTSSVLGVSCDPVMRR